MPPWPVRLHQLIRDLRRVQRGLADRHCGEHQGDSFDVHHPLERDLRVQDPAVAQRVARQQQRVQRADGQLRSGESDSVLLVRFGVWALHAGGMERGRGLRLELHAVPGVLRIVERPDRRDRVVCQAQQFPALVGLADRDAPVLGLPQPDPAGQQQLQHQQPGLQLEVQRGLLHPHILHRP